MISIIIPTYNRADLLTEAIAPLMSMGQTPVESIIVDDASTDATADVVAEWIRVDGYCKIVYLRQERNQGAQAARNRGIAAAKGDFLMFMDSDDVPDANGILELHRLLAAHPGLAYAYGVVRKTDAVLASVGEDVGAAFEDIPREIAGYHWHTMGALYRRECIERVGPWNPELTGSQDWEYQARVKMFGGKGEFVDTLVGYWRQHDGERVGTARFRPDYVRSVMLACESILSKARKCGRCDVELEKRIAKRLVVHALEWGANGCLAERRECFEQSFASLGGAGSLAAIIRAWGKAPAWGDASLWRFLTKS